MFSRMPKLIVAAAALAATTALNPAVAQASPETDYLQDLTNAGFIIYDTRAALNTGYTICDALNYNTGDVVAYNLYTHTSWADIQTMQGAATWVIIAGTNLCPWQYHPERVTDPAPGFVA